MIAVLVLRDLVKTGCIFYIIFYNAHKNNTLISHSRKFIGCHLTPPTAGEPMRFVGCMRNLCVSDTRLRRPEAAGS